MNEARLAHAGRASFDRPELPGRRDHFLSPAAGFFVVVFVSVFFVVVEPVADESLPVEPVEPVAVELPVEPVDEPVPIVEPEPVEPVEPIVESDDGVVGAGVAAAGATGVVVEVDVVDVDVAFGSVMVPDVFCVSGVFGGSSLPPQATRPAKHAPTNRAEIFMLKLPSGRCPPFAPTPSAPCGEVAAWCHEAAAPFPIGARPSARPMPIRMCGMASHASRICRTYDGSSGSECPGTCAGARYSESRSVHFAPRTKRSASPIRSAPSGPNSPCAASGSSQNRVAIPPAASALSPTRMVL